LREDAKEELGLSRKEARKQGEKLERDPTIQVASFADFLGKRESLFTIRVV